MTELDKLIESVEHGALPESVFHGCSVIRGHWAYTTGLDYMQRKNVYMAYNGSLDAAMALHEALLPNCMWQRQPTGQFNIFDRDADEIGYGFCEGNPARAWLLAILRAHRSLHTDSA